MGKGPDRGKPGTILTNEITRVKPCCLQREVWEIEFLIREWVLEAREYKQPSFATEDQGTADRPMLTARYRTVLP